MDSHQGGCLCGAVRFEVQGQPFRSAVCHCRYCQLRTGASFRLSVYFPEDYVTVLSGRMQIYEHPTESGNTWDIQRCARCGTSVFWTVSGEPWAGLLGISGGCFDPPTFWYDIDREVFVRSRAEFCTIDTPERHDTHPAYQPRKPDPRRLSGDE